MKKDVVEIIDGDLGNLRRAVATDIEARLLEGAVIVSARDGEVSSKRKADGQVIARTVGHYGPTEADATVRVHVRSRAEGESRVAAA